MKLNKERIKRCAIFLFFDKDGVVDDYVVNMLEDLQKNVEFLLVVCNGYVCLRGLERLNQVADEVLCRANLGFDVGGYREGLFYIGWKKLEEYDELVLMNYTFFGPLYPFSEMFQKMQEKDVDFWGLTKFHKVDGDPFHAISYGYIPEHLQSHFWVLRRDFFVSYQYRDFIMNMKNPNSYIESICNYEAIFTKYFSDLGFKWDVYMDTTEYEGYSYYPVMFYAKELIQEKRCPIIKRRSFFTDYTDFLLNTCGEASMEAYEYIYKNNIYDVNMIWDNILRLENLTAVQRSLHLNYILESYATDYNWTDRIAIVIIVNETDADTRLETILNQFPEKLETYVFDISEKESVSTRAINTSIQDDFSYVSCLDMASRKLREKNYDYIGVLYLNDNILNENWKNLFENKHIIGNAIGVFKNNPRMGMLIPPVELNENDYVEMVNGWAKHFDEVTAFLKKEKISLNVTKNEKPLSPADGCFWIKGTLFYEIVNYLQQKEMAVALSLLPFLIQNKGYFTGIGRHDEMISGEITNQDYMLRENNKIVFKNYGPTYHHLIVDRIQNDDFSSGE